MKRILLILCAFGLCSHTFATPVSGLYFASKWIENREEEYTESDVYAFQLGMLFPDISYMNVPLRFEPEEPVSLAEIQEADTPFEKGRLLHYYIRDLQTKVMDRVQLCDSFEGIPDQGRELLVKMLEDHYYYDEVDKATIREMLDEVLNDEEDAGVPNHQLRTWHRVLGQYLSMNAFTILLKLKQFNMGVFGVTKETVAEWAREFPTLIESVDFQTYIAELESEFAKALHVPLASISK